MIYVDMNEYRFEEIWSKGSSALRLSAKMHRGEWGVWLEVCRAMKGMERKIPSKGERKYNWEGKLVFRLSEKDLSQIGSRLEIPQKGILVDLFHHFGEKKKQFQVTMDGPDRFFLKAQETAVSSISKEIKGDRTESIVVLLDGADLWGFKECIKIAYRGLICNKGNGFVEQAI